MTVPDPLCQRADLLRARADVEECAALLRRGAALAWESPAADAFRREVAEVVAALHLDLRTLEETAVSLR